MIHNTAIISKKAIIGENVKIGAYCVIGDNVKLADNVEILSHVCIDGNTSIGEGTIIYPFASIGYAPQDLKFDGEDSKLIIGKNNTIREYVTMHPGTKVGRMQTVVGDNNLFMIAVHVAHDCIVGNNIVFGNQCTLAGHVIIEDNVILGGLSAVHQFVRIGHNAVIGGMSGVEKDVIPYGAVKGERAHLYGINIIGMKRADISKNEIFALKKAYNMIFQEEGILLEKVKAAQEHFDSMCVSEVIQFITSKSDRSFCLPENL